MIAFEIKRSETSKISLQKKNKRFYSTKKNELFPSSIEYFLLFVFLECLMRGVKFRIDGDNDVVPLCISCPVTFSGRKIMLYYMHTYGQLFLL